MVRYETAGKVFHVRVQFFDTIADLLQPRRGHDFDPDLITEKARVSEDLLHASSSILVLTSKVYTSALRRGKIQIFRLSSPKHPQKTKSC
jgi:hypothetical protein